MAVEAAMVAENEAAEAVVADLVAVAVAADVAEAVAVETVAADVVAVEAAVAADETDAKASFKLGLNSA